ncbi:hypothetical protein TSUD_316390 [Trifolium subterraneum]|uniref:Uncharacterized protein n=1 Tax=Trifolium subterraneum TaxID=3900 RepID=A0A2Z6N347_TRISU|nr:hypothetical protein TSUD_316390 [Trifolium subterraneum]
MERKQGLFSSLKDDLIKGLSPASSTSPMSSLLRRRKKEFVPPLDLFIGGAYPSTPVRPPVEAMSPLKEGPEDTECSIGTSSSSDLRLLLGVLGAPLAPLHVSTTEPFPHLAIKDIPIIMSFYLNVPVLLYSKIELNR